DRGPLRRDAGDRPRMWAGRRRLLRLLGVRDARAEAVAAVTGHRRDANYQQAGRHPRLHDGTLRDGRGLWCLGGVGALGAGRTLRPVPPRRWRAVPPRHDPADDRLPRAPKRSVGEGRAAQRQRRELLETLSLGLDRVEPRAGRRGSRRGGHAHRGAPCL
ncbi:hypothetical protein AVDCRST_MAG82-705, partial [uncultured Rubrobacteraceae bacterium]